ncbi:MAG: hypothetical protein LBO09_02285 [Candidatus Peribacteria bacterium]|nr:hypothetical protein [Candidatus Peribacteria bacterium]
MGGVLGALFTGCPSCSIGITSFLGLGSLLSALPCHGLEVKVLALLLLLRSNWSMYQKLLVCNVKK